MIRINLVAGEPRGAKRASRKLQLGQKVTLAGSAHLDRHGASGGLAILDDQPD